MAEIKIENYPTKRDQWRSIPVGESVLLDATEIRLENVRVELWKLSKKEGIKFTTSRKGLPVNKIRITRIA